MNVAICDDQPEEIKLVKATIQHYAAEHRDWTITISEYTNPLLFLEALARNGGFDIVLLDIYMPGILGIDVAREIRQRQDQTEIIFLTSCDDFAVDAFALKATHYLIKPITQAQLDEALDRAIGHITKHQIRKMYFVTENGSVQATNINDILYIESYGHTQTVHFKDSTCTEMRRSLSQLAEELEKLSPGQFIMPYKGYLVNQKSIRVIDPRGISLYNGQRIPIPKRGFRELREQYFNYIFREGND